MYQEEVRANKFDEWVGERQTLKSMEMGTGKSILDIGCGIGQFTPLFKKRFERVVGLDPSEEYLEYARKHTKGIEYFAGWGETFKLKEKFDTINMTNLLEHVDNPTSLLKNCKRHLNPNGRIIAQVPNANSITRRLGVIMGIIDSIEDISEKEIKVYGHQRVYTLDTLKEEPVKAGLHLYDYGGILYKPLPNDMLYEICINRRKNWRDKFMDALIEFGKDRPEECAQLYIVCG